MDEASVADRYRTLSKLYRIVVVLAVTFGGIYLYAILDAFLVEGVPAEFANKDFANYWTAGKLILSGETADLFGPHENYFRHLTAVFGEDYQWHNWSYPPHHLLLLWPLGYFGYETSLVLFLAATGFLYALALRRFSGEAWFMVLIASAPLITYNIWTAQNGFLSAGLALGALALRDSRPVIAGVLLGFLTFKPQLGFLFPFLLLAERRWSVIASAALTTVTLVALSALIFGVEAWSGYISEVLPYQTLVMRELGGAFLVMLPSIYGSMRSWGFSADPALTAHLVLAVPAAILAISSFWLVAEMRWRSIILLIATFIITPYALTYDFGMAAAAIGLMVHMGDRRGLNTSRHELFFATAMLTPLLMMPLGTIGIAYAPLVLAVVFALALVRSGYFEQIKALRSGFSRPSPAAASD